MGPIGLAGMHCDPQASIPYFAKVFTKQGGRIFLLVPCKIDGNKFCTLPEQNIQLVHATILTIAATEDTNKVGIDTCFVPAGLNTIDHGLDDCRRIEAVRFGHKYRTETQLYIFNVLIGRIQDVFIGNTPAGVRINHHRGEVLKASNKSHQPRFAVGNLDVWPQRFNVVCRQPYAILIRQVQDCLQPNTAIEVTVQVYQRQLFIICCFNFPLLNLRFIA